MGIALLDACPRFHFLGSGVFFCCCYFNPHPHLTPINLSNLMVDLLVVCSKSTFVPSLERILVARQCQNSVNKQTSTALIQLIGAHRHLSLPLLLCRLTRRKDEHDVGFTYFFICLRGEGCPQPSKLALWGFVRHHPS